MLLPWGNLFECREEVLSLQPMIRPNKRFDITPPPPLTGGCSEGLNALGFFFKQRILEDSRLEYRTVLRRGLNIMIMLSQIIIIIMS